MGVVDWVVSERGREELLRSGRGLEDDPGAAGFDIDMVWFKTKGREML